MFANQRRTHTTLSLQTVPEETKGPWTRKNEREISDRVTRHLATNIGQLRLRRSIVASILASRKDCGPYVSEFATRTGTFTNTYQAKVVGHGGSDFTTAQVSTFGIRNQHTDGILSVWPSSACEIITAGTWIC
jgi:hypothetical protein